MTPQVPTDDPEGGSTGVVPGVPENDYGNDGDTVVVPAVPSTLASIDLNLLNWNGSAQSWELLVDGDASGEITLSFTDSLSVVHTTDPIQLGNYGPGDLLLHRVDAVLQTPYFQPVSINGNSHEDLDRGKAACSIGFFGKQFLSGSVDTSAATNADIPGTNAVMYQKDGGVWTAVLEGGPFNADQVGFDPAQSGIPAGQMQSAFDQLAALVPAGLVVVSGMYDSAVHGVGVGFHGVREIGDPGGPVKQAPVGFFPIATVINVTTHFDSANDTAIVALGYAEAGDALANPQLTIDDLNGSVVGDIVRRLGAIAGAHAGAASDLRVQVAVEALTAGAFEFYSVGVIVQ